MNIRDGKTRLILVAVALGLALVVMLASCGGDGGDSNSNASAGQSDDSSSPGNSEGADDEQENSPVVILGSVTGEGSLTLTISRAEREEGGFLTLEGRLQNNGGETFFEQAWRGAEEELAVNGFSMAGATLTAKSEGKRYLILRDTTGRCLCTGFGNGVSAGETVEWFAQFPAPDPATTEVDFQIGRMPTVTIEIR
ncbi:hypothetical protein [Streptomyces alkaliphilus]|uniref:hypothetical protein n=1 Tax=Streptomyces alkaliphilus TaxID=1472722 RepID=UPI001180936F|nr:hypothetical protein [Streptomyces alkaliphilus]MQS07968.1 hypothetical protein [Streptomyces alkaliphilus]